MYMYNTILCVISPLHQITKKLKKKLVYANARVFLTQCLWDGKFDIVLSSDCCYQFLSIFPFFFFFESHENTILEFFFAI